ncbi:PREDICTED: evolutionarily conserved signaling intermediate in Toll pathway, mitochondrial [Nanorana parkeri]|uniref:evolutionarily conserved signaling intermediate in Toll pathway, mitochondrial n=1 Tax=Nanorana parkeri TaxID=125878 RepID=UPI000854EF46|nr:PREDICTED: evolutionarily conserved signaling intermediate in Toll pathway, mitochondrial [Nanorana parkeri]
MERRREEMERRRDEMERRREEMERRRDEMEGRREEMERWRDCTSIPGIQSPDQMALLAEHDHNYPVIVEGPFPLWLKKICVNYYVLRAEPNANKLKKTLDPERSLYYPIHLDLDLERDLGDDYTFDVDEVEEGSVYGMCMAGDEKLLTSWIQGLQETNPILGEVPVLFRLTTGPQQERLPVKQKDSSSVESDEDSTQEERLRMEQ